MRLHASMLHPVAHCVRTHRTAPSPELRKERCVRGRERWRVAALRVRVRVGVKVGRVCRAAHPRDVGRRETCGVDDVPVKARVGRIDVKPRVVLHVSCTTAQAPQAARAVCSEQLAKQVLGIGREVPAEVGKGAGEEGALGHTSPSSALRRRNLAPSVQRTGASQLRPQGCAGKCPWGSRHKMAGSPRASQK